MRLGIKLLHDYQRFMDIAATLKLLEVDVAKQHGQTPWVRCPCSHHMPLTPKRTWQRERARPKRCRRGRPGLWRWQCRSSRCGLDFCCGRWRSMRGAEREVTLARRVQERLGVDIFADIRRLAPMPRRCRPQGSHR